MTTMRRFVAIKADRAGAIVTLSCHMPNFAEVAKRDKMTIGAIRRTM